MSPPSLFWFRDDLRLADNPGLLAACRAGAVVPVYVLDEDSPGARPFGGAARWWLHRSLAALARSLEAAGSRLILRRGAAEREIPRLVAETGARAAFWNRRYQGWTVGVDSRLKTALAAEGVAVESFAASLLWEPWTLATKSGGPFRVFSPFWRAALALGEPPAPEPPPPRVPAPQDWPASERLDDWDLTPRAPDWAGGLRRSWSVGEAAAQDRLAAFLDSGLAGYKNGRDRPDLAQSSSRLSPHLRWGEIGPRQVWRAARAAGSAFGAEPAAEAFLRELGWREFSHHLLFHFPHMAKAPLDPRFSAFPWRDDPADLRAWRRGRTGYPLVDAGMRQLWEQGWMHNRARMVAASFLVKDLLQDWRVGEAWFWDMLVDADPANNAASWQWVAGCGADAAPFFRVFNPVLQGRKFDPDGAYVRRWVPELALVPAPEIHEPWRAPKDMLRDAGVVLDQTYPNPIVDHGDARRRALDAFERLRAA